MRRKTPVLNYCIFLLVLILPANVHASKPEAVVALAHAELARDRYAGASGAVATEIEYMDNLLKRYAISRKAGDRITQVRIAERVAVQIEVVRMAHAVWRLEQAMLRASKHRDTQEARILQLGQKKKLLGARLLELKKEVDGIVGDNVTGAVEKSQ